MKLQEHRQKLDQHKMYLMHIASEADIVEQQEDSVLVPLSTHCCPLSHSPTQLIVLAPCCSH